MLVEPESTNNINENNTNINYEYNNNYIYNYVENNTYINYNNNIFNNIINNLYNSRRRRSSSRRNNNRRVNSGNSSPVTRTQTPPWRGNDVKCPFCRRECQCNEWVQTDEAETCDICFHSNALCKSSQCGHKMCAECLERIRR